MKTIYMHGSYYSEGTKVKQCFEGKLIKGTLHDGEDDKIAIKDSQGKIRWCHASFVTLDTFQF